MGTRRFILAKHVGQAVAFSLATYTVATPPAASGRRQTLAEAAVQPFAFASFSGSLTLRGLTSGERAIFAYQNGQLVSKKPAVPAAGQKASATSSFDCVTIYTCYWQSLCSDGRGNIITSGTITQSTDSCTEPGYEACGIMVWGIGWNDIGFDTYEQCVQVDDPPVPDPNDPGSPGGGGYDPTQTNEVINNLTPCLSQSYSSLIWMTNLYDYQILSTGTSSALLPITFFSGPTNNWELRVGTLPNGTPGQTIDDYTNMKVVTTLDPQQLQNATDLSAMALIMHESVHAYLVAYFNNDPTLFNATYSQLFDEYNYRTSSGMNNAQHDLMVTNFKNEIGKSYLFIVI